MRRAARTRVDLSVGSIIQTVIMLTLAYIFYSILPPSFSKMAKHVPDEDAPAPDYSSQLPYTIMEGAVSLALSQFYAMKSLLGLILLPSSFFSIFIAWRNNSHAEVVLSVLLCSALTAAAIASYNPSM